MHKQKLTGWLILFMVWVGLTGVNGLGSLGAAEGIWRKYMADYPSLRGAVMVFQLLSGAGIVAWLYTAWVLYQRKPGTLRRAQSSLLLGGLLRLGGGWSIIVFGGLPPDMVRRLMSQAGFGSCVILLVTGAWYLYLLRSERVREVYAN
jgi:hypothetical protein